MQTIKIRVYQSFYQFIESYTCFRATFTNFSQSSERPPLFQPFSVFLKMLLRSKILENFANFHMELTKLSLIP